MKIGITNERMKIIAKAVVAEILEDEWISANRVIPAHELRDEEKLQYLMQSMEEEGWVGLPILVFEDPDLTNGDLHAFTGVHRLNAAQGLDMEVPIISIERECRNKGFDDDFLADLWDELDAARDDDDLRSVLVEVLPEAQVTYVMLKEEEHS